MKVKNSAFLEENKPLLKEFPDAALERFDYKTGDGSVSYEMIFVRHRTVPCLILSYL